MTFDSEGFGGFEEGADVFLGDADLAAVDELEDGPQFCVLDVFEDDDGMGAGVLQEQRLEVGRTGGQDDLVALDRRPAHGQRHVRQRLGLQQLLEDTQQVRSVVVPAQAVLLTTTTTGSDSAATTHATDGHCQLNSIDFR